MDKKLFEALDSLCDMWDQYCPQPYGHMCMSAGEGAEQVLNEYGLLEKDGGYGGSVNYKKLEELRKSVT